MRFACKFLCTKCKIAMRRYVSWPLHGRPQSICGQCGSAMSYVHHKFRAPPKRDAKMWRVIQHLEGAGLISILDRGHIPQNMREADMAISAARETAIENQSPTRYAERRARWHRSENVQLKRQRSKKAKRWARLSKYGKA